MKIRLLWPVALLLSSVSASAATITLTFEGLLNLEGVAEFYNGGLGGSGSGPGPNYGVSFVSNGLAIIDADEGGSGNFANEPSPDTVLFFVSGSAVMNVAAGFDTGFSFFYSAISQPGFVRVYDAPDAGGTLLAQIDLPVTSSACPGDPNGQFCVFEPIGVLFSGIARSVDFGGTVDEIAFDNVTLGSDTPGSGVPEPATYALVAAGLGMIALSRRRRNYATNSPPDAS